MADIPQSESQNTKDCKDGAPYEKMSDAMRWQWNERVFNLFKLRGPLLSADAVLAYAFVLWAAFGMIAIALSAINTERFPLRLDPAYALAAFLIYYSVIGFIRRQTERNFVSYSSQYIDVKACMTGELFKDRKPYDETNDPPLAKAAFRLRSVLGLPRRGLAQGTVVLWQFVVVLCYVWNYAWYVLYRGDVTFLHHPSLLWVYQVTFTGGGLLILFKNAGFLIDTSKLLKTIEALVGGIMGHSHQTTRVQVEGGDKKPCDDKEKK